jgi:hypothetical protein
MWECDSEDEAAQIWLSKLLLRHLNVRLQIFVCSPRFSCQDILYRNEGFRHLLATIPHRDFSINFAYDRIVFLCHVYLCGPSLERDAYSCFDLADMEAMLHSCIIRHVFTMWDIAHLNYTLHLSAATYTRKRASHRALRP